MRTMLFVVLALPAIATAQNQPTTDLAENALLSVFQRDASNTVCSPRNASLKEMRALFDPYIKGIDLNNQASYLTLSQAVYTAFPCPFSPLRAELKPAVKEELLGNWLFPDASLRLRHGPKSPAWQPPSPNIPHINCEGVMFNETGEYRVAQIRGQFACPTPASMQAMRTFPAVQSWTTLPNGRVKISRTDVPAQFEEWEIYTVKAPFEFFSIKFAVGDLVAYLRRHPGNEIGATTTFRHLQPLK